ncbi:beta-ketoacyl-[acyl-carrier-protein] synthase II [Malassezia sp. CBS 17886]|nr:beta-ketoacyl-[acyl-carrier-protein] synthase II [Malassezia sp. CBS 17886]
MSARVSSMRRPRKREPLLRRSLAPLSPSTPPAPSAKYSPWTVSVLKGIGKMLGYNFVRSKAVRVTGDLYDRAAARGHAESHFWYKECALPASFQTWFQLTNLHVFLLLARFRALPAEEARVYSQELVNHFFIDTESRMRERFGVQTQRLVKGYLRDLHLQHRGSMIAYDEGLATDDVRLSAAVWRNVWGGGWGSIAGVKRRAPIFGTRKKDLDQAAEQESGPAELIFDKDAAPSNDPEDSDALDDRVARAEILFPQHLERVTRWLRRELYRLGHLPDATITDGDVHAARAPAGDDVEVLHSQRAAEETAAEVRGGQEPEDEPVVSAYTRL